MNNTPANYLKLAFTDVPEFDCHCQPALASMIEESQQKLLGTVPVKVNEIVDSYKPNAYSDVDKAMQNQIRTVLVSGFVYLVSLQRPELLWNKEQFMSVYFFKEIQYDSTEWDYLVQFRNMLAVALTFLSGNRNKGLLMAVCARLEGSGCVYTTGSGQIDATSRREEIYKSEKVRQEANVAMNCARQAMKLMEQQCGNIEKTAEKRGQKRMLDDAKDGEAVTNSSNIIMPTVHDSDWFAEFDNHDDLLGNKDLLNEQVESILYTPAVNNTASKKTTTRNLAASDAQQKTMQMQKRVSFSIADRFTGCEKIYAEEKCVAEKKWKMKEEINEEEVDETNLIRMPTRRSFP